MGIPGVDLHVPASIALHEQELLEGLRAMSDAEFFERAAARMGHEHAAEVLGWSAIAHDVAVEEPVEESPTQITYVPQQTADVLVPATA